MTRILMAGLFGLIGAAAFAGSPAHAATYAIGQRAECDATGLKKYYMPGTIIAPHPGDRFNGYEANTGHFYRVHIDGRDEDGTLCLAADMRPAGGGQQAAAAAAKPGAMAAAAPASRNGRPTPPPGQNLFGTREPRTNCPPVRSQPNPAQIAMLIQCADERKTGEHIYLDDHISVEAGSTRAYAAFSDSGSTGIDTDARVLPIRGSVDSYQCAALYKYTNVGTVYDTDNTGKSCALWPVRNASGTCWHTTFGDWKCHLNENIDLSLVKNNQPPPH